MLRYTRTFDICKESYTQRKDNETTRRGSTMRASVVHHRIMYSSHNESPRLSANAFAGKRKALEMRICKLSL